MRHGFFYSCSCAPTHHHPVDARQGAGHLHASGSSHARRYKQLRWSAGAATAWKEGVLLAKWAGCLVSLMHASKSTASGRRRFPDQKGVNLYGPKHILGPRPIMRHRDSATGESYPASASMSQVNLAEFNDGEQQRYPRIPNTRFLPEPRHRLIGPERISRSSSQTRSLCRLVGWSRAGGCVQEAGRALPLRARPAAWR